MKCTQRLSLYLGRASVFPHINFSLLRLLQLLHVPATRRFHRAHGTSINPVTKRCCSPGRFEQPRDPCKWLQIRPSRLQPPSVLYHYYCDSFSPSCICLYRTLVGFQSAMVSSLHGHLGSDSLVGAMASRLSVCHLKCRSNRLPHSLSPHIQQAYLGYLCQA